MSFAFAHHRVGQIEPREFVLMRMRLRKIERAQNPLVERPMNFELKRADRVGDPFDVIAQRVRPISIG